MNTRGSNEESKVETDRSPLQIVGREFVSEIRCDRHGKPVEFDVFEEGDLEDLLRRASRRA